MLEKLPKEEKINTEKENEKSIKEYEKSASELSKNYNTTFENLFGTGLVSKEDVIRIDAKQQNKYRNEVNLDKEKLEHKGDYYKGELIAPNLENKLKKDEEKLRILLNSNLILRESTGEQNFYELKGKINGQDVLIKAIYDDENEEFKSDPLSYEGTLDGGEISPKEAEDIYKANHELQEERNKMIEGLIRERKAEKKKKEEEEKIKNTKEDLEKLY